MDDDGDGVEDQETYPGNRTNWVVILSSKLQGGPVALNADNKSDN